VSKQQDSSMINECNAEKAQCYQLEGTAMAYICPLRGCIGGSCSFASIKSVGESSPWTLGLYTSPPTGVAGDPEDAGEVAVENEGEGVSGVVGES